MKLKADLIQKNSGYQVTQNYTVSYTKGTEIDSNVSNYRLVIKNTAV
jgi:hypothetical protein